MIIKYDKETYKILGYYIGNVNDIKLNENEAIKELNVQDCGQTDIRAYNEDGSVKSIGLQIKEKILILKENEVIKDGVVVELNKNHEEDYVRLIQRDLERLDDNKKIEYDRENKKYYITEKSLEDKLLDNIISEEDYIDIKNKEIMNIRRYEYQLKVDGMRAELFDDILIRFYNEGKLFEEESRRMKYVILAKDDIKKIYKKYTQNDVKALKNKKRGR